MLADYMTQEGKYRSFSRHGLKSCASPFQENDHKNSLKKNIFFVWEFRVYGKKLTLTVQDFAALIFSLHLTTTGYSVK